MRPLILISNDDGYQAKGLCALLDMVKGMGDILVCAPDGPRSGFSMAFSNVPITLTQRSHETLADGSTIDVWSSSGTPTDCVKLAYAKLCPRKPDMVISGINHGDNASTNIHYSGTVGVAQEGAMKGIPSIAFSLCDYSADADFAPMRQLVQETIEKVMQEGLPEYVCLNVNVPKEWNGTTAVTRMAHGHWRNEVEERIHPTKGTPYYWMAGYFQNDEPDATDTDAWAIAHGIAAITPLTIEQTFFPLTGKNPQ